MLTQSDLSEYNELRVVYKTTQDKLELFNQKIEEALYELLNENRYIYQIWRAPSVQNVHVGKNGNVFFDMISRHYPDSFDSNITIKDLVEPQDILEKWNNAKIGLDEARNRNNL